MTKLLNDFREIDFNERRQSERPIPLSALKTSLHRQSNNKELCTTVHILLDNVGSCIGRFLFLFRTTGST
jgi:hypothetical protein